MDYAYFISIIIYMYNNYPTVFKAGTVPLYLSTGGLDPGFRQRGALTIIKVDERSDGISVVTSETEKCHCDDGCNWT